MKKIGLLIVCFFILNKIFPLTLELPNSELDISESDEYAFIRTAENEAVPTHPGAPEIPLKSIFFKVPAGSKIAGVNVIPQNVNRIELSKKLFPVQKAIPLFASADNDLTEADPQFYNTAKYPSEFLKAYDLGFLGDSTIGYVTIFTASYKPLENFLDIPESFLVEIEFAPVVTGNDLPSGKVSDHLLFELGLEDQVRNTEADEYLLITTTDFLSAFQPLLNWRQAQGVNVHWITITEIEDQYGGRDLQEKVRNCIIDHYESFQISYVTLGGDVDHIPDRKVFAFDCEFGAYEDENEIPADMYYSCLQGNWDANGNNIFGEDADETDYFPEVYVSRIPVNSIPEVEDYINRLIAYESGSVSDYNKAGGFSMALWSGSNSEICQQYIYDMYFPENYQIEFLWGEENTQEAAYEVMNAGQNIIQHTGHAGRQSMGLENGNIRLSDIEMLNNEWGGIFYSIGCWSAAIDYNSIGENLVSQIDKGFLGYIGNSRYGWGAPSASSFGFSEFYQKAFFRELFSGNTRLAQVNALQKLDFIPYFSGTSVYKWVAYELNALGDSYLDLKIENPRSMTYSLFSENNEYRIIVSDQNGPLDDVYITGEGISTITNDLGEATIPFNDTITEITLYKIGYRSVFLEFPVETDQFLLEFNDLPAQLSFIQGETFSFAASLTNSTDQEQTFRMICEFNPNELTVDYESEINTIPAVSTLDLGNISVSFNPISNSYQMPEGKEIFLNLKIYAEPEDSLLTQRSLRLAVAAPEIEIDSICLDAWDVDPGSTIPIQFRIKNNGTVPIMGINVEFLSDSGFLEFETQTSWLDIYLPAGESVDLSNYVYLSDSAPEFAQEAVIVRFQTSSLDQEYIFEEITFISNGRIKFSDNFESTDNWQNDPEWQLFSNEYFSPDYSFSCRPEFIGSYSAVSPLLSYLPEMGIHFRYKYKMPMYGNDGVYVILETAELADTLLFLGAGGALPTENRMPQTYIESDWAEYQIYLEEVMLNPPEPGTQFSIKLLFTVSEIIENFNQYAVMEDIGVFFDSFYIGHDKLSQDSHQNDVLLVYPNPSYSYDLPRFSVSSRRNQTIKLKIYDIRGKLVSEQEYRGLGNNRVELFWDARDQKKSDVSSGIYIILIDTGEKKYMDKFIYFN